MWPGGTPVHTGKKFDPTFERMFSWRSWCQTIVEGKSSSRGIFRAVLYFDVSPTYHEQWVCVCLEGFCTGEENRHLPQQKKKRVFVLWCGGVIFKRPNSITDIFSETKLEFFQSLQSLFWKMLLEDVLGSSRNEIIMVSHQGLRTHRHPEDDSAR